MASYTPKDHMFALCAYGESAYLEECVESLERQTIPTRIILCTATPSDFLDDVARRHGIEVFVNRGPHGIAEDWNFAYAHADASVVTLAHQDDVYDPGYVEEVLKRLNCARRPMICFTDYYELRRGRRTYSKSSKNLRVKEAVLAPLRIRTFENNRWIRRRILSLCNPICCPSVSYVREYLPEIPFKPHFASNLDWQAWEMFSRQSGGFCYIHKPLMGHRIHEESTTSKVIGNDNGRSREDLDMYLKFWPAPIALLLNKLYSAGQNSNRL